jgi:hypothetical protein
MEMDCSDQRRVHLSPRSRPYADSMGQGDVPASPGGPLRRRREKRQLGRLADKSDREVSPTAARGHVRIIGDPVDANEQAQPETPGPVGHEEDTPVESRPSGFHVQPVPIEEPFGD